MKKITFYLLLILAFPAIMISCDDDDNDNGEAPIFLSSSISADNSRIDLTFSEGLFTNEDGTGALTVSDFEISITGGTSEVTGFTVTHTEGSETVVIDLELTAASGEEILTVSPKAGSIYDADGNELAATEIAEFTLVDIGIIGDWKAYDISLILQGLGYDDSLYVHFYADDTYKVISFISGISYELAGTYEQTKSANDGIWEITANQATLNGAAYPVTSEGIFKVFPASPDSMWYEVAQASPAVAGVTPPTSEEGFGSTSGGIYGTANIQKYIRIDN